MVLIPAGEFVMGGNNYSDEKPLHTVYLDAFYIDRYPVTNAEYKKFVDATGYRAPEHWKGGKIPTGKENHPVVYVSWDDAQAYARRAGKRLPTEAEWEKAASWDYLNKEKRRYPWSNQFDVSNCNTCESGIGDTTPVSRYSPQGDSPNGVGDMAGNVFEWVADWHDSDYYHSAPMRNPKGPSSGEHRVLRGGSWRLDRRYVCVTYRYHDSPGCHYYDTGFRCAKSV
jgi:formylglycine-generating enzyme required for sulfatase activity